MKQKERGGRNKWRTVLWNRKTKKRGKGRGEEGEHDITTKWAELVGK